MDINSIIEMINKNKSTANFGGELNGLDRFRNEILEDIIEQLRKMSDGKGKENEIHSNS